MIEFDANFELGEMPTPDEDKNPYYRLEDEMDLETANNWPPYSVSPEAEEMLVAITLGREISAIDQQLQDLAKRRERIFEIFHVHADQLNDNPLQ